MPGWGTGLGRERKGRGGHGIESRDRAEMREEGEVAAADVLELVCLS